MSNLIEELQVFARVAELGSFSKAARALRISQPSASRIVSGLERRLDAKLLMRTTHELALTEAGTTFLDHARTILANVEAATEAVRDAGDLRGVLRIATPATFGTRTVIPILARFLRDHPKLRVELSPLDETQPLVSQAVDVAIRFGPLADSDFAARHLAHLPRVAVASPAYLEARGAPRTPEALAGHDCLFGPGLTGQAYWLFAGASAPPDGLIERIRSSTAEGVLACALEGLGIAVATRALCARDVADGRLVELLVEFPLKPVDLHVVFAAGRKLPLKARVFVNTLIQSLTEQGLRAG